MKAFMTSGSVICPFFYAFPLLSLPTAVLCQIPVPSPSASVNVLNSGLPHHQSTFISIPLDAYQASSIPAVVEISGDARGVGGLVARNDGFAVLTTAVPSADPTGEDRGSAGVLISEVTSDALPTRTFRNIAAATDTASVETTTSSSTETDSSTSTTAAASTDTSAAASSPDTTTAITATEVGTLTSTETTYTDPATSSVTSDVLPTRTFQDTTATTTPEPSVGTETPPASTTSVDCTTRTVKTILTLTITKIATAPHPHAPTPPAGAGAWQACGNGITCAFGHRCITFRGLVMVCVPGRGRHHQHHD